MGRSMAMDNYYSGFSDVLGSGGAALASDEVVGGELAWQREVKGNETKCHDFMEQALGMGMGLFRLYALMKPGSAFVQVVHGVAKYFSVQGAAPEYAGKHLAFMGDRELQREPVAVQFLPEEHSWGWATLVVATKREAMATFYQDGNNLGEMWKPDITVAKEEVSVPRLLALPTFLLGFLLEAQRQPHELLARVLSHIECGDTELTEDTWQVVINWCLVSAQADDKGDSLLVLHLGAAYSSERGFINWCTTQLDAAMGPRPTLLGAIQGVSCSGGGGGTIDPASSLSSSLTCAAAPIGRCMVEGLQAAAPAVVSAACDEQQGECGGGLEPLTEDMLAKLENLDCSKVCIEFISDDKLCLEPLNQSRGAMFCPKHSKKCYGNFYGPCKSKAKSIQGYKNLCQSCSTHYISDLKYLNILKSKKNTNSAFETAHKQKFALFYRHQRLEFFRQNQPNFGGKGSKQFADNEHLLPKMRSAATTASGVSPPATESVATRVSVATKADVLKEEGKVGTTIIPYKTAMPYDEQTMHNYITVEIPRTHDDEPSMLGEPGMMNENMMSTKSTAGHDCNNPVAEGHNEPVMEYDNTSAAGYKCMGSVTYANEQRLEGGKNVRPTDFRSGDGSGGAFCMLACDDSPGISIDSDMIGASNDGPAAMETRLDGLPTTSQITIEKYNSREAEVMECVGNLECFKRYDAAGMVATEADNPMSDGGGERKRKKTNDDIYANKLPKRSEASELVATVVSVATKDDVLMEGGKGCTVDRVVNHSVKQLKVATVVEGQIEQKVVNLTQDFSTIALVAERAATLASENEICSTLLYHPGWDREGSEVNLHFHAKIFEDKTGFGKNGRRRNNCLKDITPIRTAPSCLIQGIPNEHRNCYMNASIHAMFSMTGFIQEIKEYFDSVEKEKQETMIMVNILIRIGKSIGYIDKSGDEDTFDTTFLIEHLVSTVQNSTEVRWKDFLSNVHDHHDAGEFMVVFMQCIEEEMGKKCPASVLIEETERTQCISCKKFSFMTVPASNCQVTSIIDCNEDTGLMSIYDLLNNYLTTTEVTEVECSECPSKDGKLRKVTKQLRKKFTNLSKYIVFCIKRTDYNSNKTDYPVALDPMLLMQPYTLGEEKQYMLRSVVHYKEINKKKEGHFTVCVLRESEEEANGTWYEFDDTIVQAVDENSVLSSTKALKGCCLCVYELVTNETTR